MNSKNFVQGILLAFLLVFSSLDSPHAIADNIAPGHTALPPPPMTTILPQCEAEALFKFYFNGDQIFGRQDRHHSLKETYWTPTDADVAQADSALADYAKIKADAPFMTRPQHLVLNEYFRQYAGVMRGNQKYILINAFVASDVASSTAVSRNRLRSDRWHNRAVLVFDGGFAFFHASYNIAAHRIENVQFNGIA